MKETSIEDAGGHVLLTESAVYTGAGYESVGWTAFSHDDFGRVTRTETSSGRITETAWNCCGKDSYTDETGRTTAYTHDDLGRVETETRPGPSGAIVTTYIHDASGRVVSETTTGGSLTLTTSRTWDKSGRLRAETAPDGLVTRTDPEFGGRRTTVTRPGGITEIRDRHCDGRPKSLSGTGVVARFHAHGVNADGSQWTRTTHAVSDSPSWEKSTTDMIGRVIRVEKPGPEGTEISETSYDENGRLFRVTEPGKAATLFAYDDAGQPMSTALDVNGNGVIDDAGTDRIQRADTRYAQIDGAWWRESSQGAFPRNGSADTLVTAVTREKLTNLGSGVISETRTIDASGNVTLSRTLVNRSSATVTRIVDHPDSDIDDTTVSVNGLTTSHTDNTGLTVTYAYDALGRRSQVADPRTGTTVTHYNGLGRISGIDVPAGRSVTYGYDPVTGRKTTETDAAGKVTRYAYNGRNQVTHVWGDVPFPARYEYDAHGRLRTLRTFRTVANWASGTWPSDAGPGDPTTWTYDDATGLLSAKTYADGKGVSYTYRSGGRLHTRTWARTANGAALVTTYGYDDATGDLTDIDYSDDTPDIAFTHDRAGRQETVTDAAGTRTFTYDGVLLDAEILAGAVSRTIDYTHDATPGTAGRPTGLSLGPNHRITYGYDHGRVNGISWQIGAHAGAVSYSYDKGLLNEIGFNNGPTVTRTYDPTERWLTQVKNQGANGVISQYDYTHDALGRRETLTHAGAAFANGASYRRFAYNDRSEVTESDAHAGADIASTASPLAPQYRAYAYDPIGNRSSATDWDAQTGSTLDLGYTANALNQYTTVATTSATDVPEYDDDGNMTRLSAAGALMTYNAENRLSSVTREALTGDVTDDGAVDLADAIAALQTLTATDGVSVTTTGDANRDGKVGIEEAIHALRVAAGLANAVGATQRLVFDYDYMGRRVRKALYADDGGTPALVSETRFVYDGWNLIEEIQADGASRYYVWGLDLSQTFQGAGGVGGLLCAVDGDASYFYLYDGNGNVGQLVNAADGSVAAHYEYDPFGNLVASVGDYAGGNAFRFSTKYYDDETGFVYFGFRYYLSKLGRWISRDPIEELGGINLYVSCLNNTANTYDYLGLVNTLIEKIKACMATGEILEAVEYAELASGPMAMNLLRQAQSLQKTIQAVIGKYPASSFNCDKLAQKLYDTFISVNANPQFIKITDQYAAPIFTTDKGVTFARTGFHYAVRVGDKVFDAITGSNGMLFNEYITLLKSYGICPIIQYVDKL